LKLHNYLPETPRLMQSMMELDKQVNMMTLMKAPRGGGQVGQAPTIGLDNIVTTWVRHQQAYRRQLVQDLQTIHLSQEEVRGPINHVTGEVFRRGIAWEAKVENPDESQKERFMEFMKSANLFNQSLEDVLRVFHQDVNIIDDGFLYMVKEYYSNGDSLTSRVKEIRRMNPAVFEFDLDDAGIPMNSHYLCPIHRGQVETDPGLCGTEDSHGKCPRQKIPAMYKMWYNNKHLYFFDDEVIHLSKFYPGETYGWPALMTVFEKVLTLIGMDKNLYRYFYERRMPASMLMVTTDDAEGLKREREHIAAQTRVDPNYIPIVAVSARQGTRGRVDMVRLFHTLQEMDYLPVREEIRERISAMWGVTPAWQGAPEAFGGLSTQTQQLVVMSRVVEGDQRLFHDKVFPKLMDAFGITDWDLKLEQPEEKSEATRLSFVLQRSQAAAAVAQMGFTVELKGDNLNLEDVDFMVSGEPVILQMQQEQQALQIEQMQQQMEMQEEQSEQMEQGAEGGEEGGEDVGDDDAGGGGLEGGEPEEAPAEGEGAEPIQAMLAKMNTYSDAQSFYNSIAETDESDSSENSEDSDASDAVDD